MQIHKIKIGIFLFFFPLLLASRSFVLENQNQLLEKTTDFIQKISTEIYEKTHIALYIVALENLNGTSLQEKQDSYLQSLQEPYVVLFFTKDEKKINILTSQGMDEIFNKNDVYWDYIVPLIPTSTKDLVPSKISAFLLNGYLDIVEKIASYYNLKLENEFIKDNKGVQLATKSILYLMLFSLLILFIFVYLRKKE